VSGCGRKKAYATREDAELDGAERTGQIIYECDYCRLYHRATPGEVKTLSVIKKLPTEKQKHNWFYAALRRGEI
jgi:hypothetical protein